jgi:hypothetical protein
VNARTVDDFFAGHEESRSIFNALRAAIGAMGPAELRVSKSQVAFARGSVFARVWIPGQYLGGGHAPVVLTLSFRLQDPSPRWKEIVEPAPGRFTHHLELHSPNDVDDEVRGWLRETRQGLHGVRGGSEGHMSRRFARRDAPRAIQCPGLTASRYQGRAIGFRL